MRRGVAAKTVALSDLVAGQPRAYVAVHTLAMFNLVADPEAVTVDTVPETLTFDVSRLSAIHHELNRIVNQIKASNRDAALPSPLPPIRRFL